MCGRIWCTYGRASNEFSTIGAHAWAFTVGRVNVQVEFWVDLVVFCVGYRVIWCVVFSIILYVLGDGRKLCGVCDGLLLRLRVRA